ncbi:hypothetical protein C0995_013290 [Termitomyces sp. Mi166|nr:hypothetical protein C0995_013290 [Termitomyces sp. Mi166\
MAKNAMPLIPEATCFYSVKDFLLRFRSVDMEEITLKSEGEVGVSHVANRDKIKWHRRSKTIGSGVWVS